MLIFGIILLIKAFQTSILWGLGSIFVPFVSLIFVIKYWGICKKPFLYSCGGVVIYAIGMAMLIPSLTSDSSAGLEEIEAGIESMETPALPAQ